MTKWEKIKSDPVRHAAHKTREMARVNRDRKAYNAKKKAWSDSTKERYLARKRQQYANNPEVYRAKCRRNREKMTPEQKDRRRLTHREWCKANRKIRRESIARCRRKRAKEAPEMYRQYRRNKYRKRKQNPTFSWMFKNKIRSSIAYVVRRGKLSKCGRTVSLVGCTYVELKDRLEAWFRNGMTWDNWGTAWQIDHIQPISSFDLSNPDHQRQCCHYSNLQPLWTWENIRKRDHVPEYII